MTVLQHLRSSYQQLQSLSARMRAQSKNGYRITRLETPRFSLQPASLRSTDHLTVEPVARERLSSRCEAHKATGLQQLPPQACPQPVSCVPFCCRLWLVRLNFCPDHGDMVTAVTGSRSKQTRLQERGKYKIDILSQEIAREFLVSRPSLVGFGFLKVSSSLSGSTGSSPAL